MDFLHHFNLDPTQCILRCIQTHHLNCSFTNYFVFILFSRRRRGPSPTWRKDGGPLLQQQSFRGKIISLFFCFFFFHHISLYFLPSIYCSHIFLLRFELQYNLERDCDFSTSLTFSFLHSRRGLKE